MKIANFDIGNNKPLTFIAGPCVIESAEHATEMALQLKEIFDKRGVNFIFKASWDKANRSKDSSYRGVDFYEGLSILDRIRNKGIPVTTDFHESSQFNDIDYKIDLVQVPALLSRQTSLITAAADYGPVNIKKGQFMSPDDAILAYNKARVLREEVILTERGTCFGYNNVIVDMRAIAYMKQFAPVFFDCTHTTQLPGLADGRAEYIETLARAAVAVGVAGIFMEVHDNPEKALSDGPNMLKLSKLAVLLDGLLELDTYAKAHPQDGPLRNPR